MANISIQISTDGPQLDVSIDGVSIPNVNDISVYNYTGSDGKTKYVSLSIYTTEVMQNGVVKQVNYYASGTEEAEAAIASGNALDTDTIPGYVGIDAADANFKARQDIETFFTTKRR